MHKIVRITVIVAVALVGLLALIATQSNAVNAAGGGPGTYPYMGSAAQVIGGDETGLRELLGRVVGGSPYPDQQSVVYVGQLPENLPFDLSIPEGSRTVGSIVYGIPGDTRIMVDTSKSPSAVVQFFRDALQADPWQEIKNNPANGGFVAQPSATANFCYGQNQAMLNVVAEANEKITHILLYINHLGEGSACPNNSEVVGPGEPYTLLPQLNTPQGVELLPSSGGGGTNGAMGYRSAVISTNLSSKLPLNELADAYNQQLEDIGWQAVDSEIGNHIAQSGWTLVDTSGKTWTGTFLLTANPAVADQYMAQVTIQEIAQQ